MYFRYFVIISPLEKRVALHLNKVDSPSSKGCFVQTLVEIGLVVMEEKFTDRRTTGYHKS